MFTLWTITSAIYENSNNTNKAAGYVQIPIICTEYCPTMQCLLLIITRDLRCLLLNQVRTQVHLSAMSILTQRTSWSGLLVAYALEILPFRLRAKGLMIMNITVQAILAVGNQTNPVAWANLPKHWVRSTSIYIH